MNTKEIQLNKEQFKVLNDDDQFQLFCDEEGFPDFDDFNAEVNKLFDKFDYISVTKDDYIYGVKGKERELLSSQATEAYYIAQDIVG